MARNGRGVKEKGTNGEREFAKKIGGRRIPLSGQAKGYRGDVEGLGLTWEVKRRKDGFGQLYKWLNGENIDALAIRADKKPWLVVMDVEKLLEWAEMIKRGEVDVPSADHRHEAEVDEVRG